MADWTTLIDDAVGVGGLPSGTTVTALRDNPIAIAERAAGAPKILGVSYDYQEFLASGTWTKPANAESGDTVIVYLVGGGGGGRKANGSIALGGSGGAGLLYKISDIDALAATATVTVGAGGSGITSNGNGNLGGNSRFNDGTLDIGAEGGNRNSIGDSPSRAMWNNTPWESGTPFAFQGGNHDIGSIASAHYGGAAGGKATTILDDPGFISAFAGNGGRGGRDRNALAGEFPGGGGGGGEGVSSFSSGAGANGVVRVWCIKES